MVNEKQTKKCVEVVGLMDRGGEWQTWAYFSHAGSRCPSVRKRGGHLGGDGEEGGKEGRRKRVKKKVEKGEEGGRECERVEKKVEGGGG